MPLYAHISTDNNSTEYISKVRELTADQYAALPPAKRADIRPIAETGSGPDYTDTIETDQVTRARTTPIPTAAQIAAEANSRILQEVGDHTAQMQMVSAALLAIYPHVRGNMTAEQQATLDDFAAKAQKAAAIRAEEARLKADPAAQANWP